MLVLFSAMRHRSGFSDVGVRLDRWKVTKAYDGPWKLYNINEDISEKNDISKQHPEQLNIMVAGAKKWSEGHEEPLWFDPVELKQDWKDKNIAQFPNTFKID